MKVKKKRNLRRTTSHKSQVVDKQPFIEHVQELRRRLYYVALSVIVWGCAAYAVQMHITNLLLKPSHGEKFIYTTPGGGIDFLFRVCLYTALILSLPVIVYNFLRFTEPLINKHSSRFIIWGTFTSGVLAVLGVIFGYVLGLPPTIHFLMHQFTTVQIQPMVTIQSYLGFVVVYMLGSAMLFQLPLILLFINRIKPLSPRKLLHYERWVIVIAFILAALMNPTPNIISLLLIAAPFILMYQVGIGMIAWVNRPRRSKKVVSLIEKDRAAQAERLEAAKNIVPLALPQKLMHKPQPSRRSMTTMPRRSYIDDFAPPRRTMAPENS